MTKRSLYVLLDDTRKDDKSVHDPGFKYWLEVADLLCGHSPVLIFQNEEEFDVAHQQFKKTGKPHIFTFFKNADIKTGNMPKQDLKSMWDFQERLSKLGHFYTEYEHIEHLKRQFNDQLEKLREKGI